MTSSISSALTIRIKVIRRMHHRVRCSQHASLLWLAPLSYVIGRDSIGHHGLSIMNCRDVFSPQPLLRSSHNALPCHSPAGRQKRPLASLPAPPLLAHPEPGPRDKCPIQLRTKAACTCVRKLGRILRCSYREFYDFDEERANATSDRPASVSYSETIDDLAAGFARADLGFAIKENVFVARLLNAEARFHQQPIPQRDEIDDLSEAGSREA